MYTHARINEIHKTLQAFDPSALVLLGGSYLYGEAGEESDVDFYWLCPSWRVFFLAKFKKSIQNLKNQFPEIDFSVMIVPKWLRRHGYYIYGQDVHGKIHTWELPIRTLMRNCVKLAYFNYLRFLVFDKIPSPRGRGTEGEGPQRNLVKVAKQLAVAEFAAQGKIDFSQPFFSWEYIQTPPSRGAHGGCKSSACLVTHQPTTTQWSYTPTTPLEGGLDRAYHKFLPYFTFSFSNYLLYNTRFLLRGNPLFLFQNPDKMIIKRLKRGFDKREDPANLCREIKEIIFPVIIL